MPIIPAIGRKSAKLRGVIAAIYITLTLLGITMVTPFLITLAGSAANDYDYDRFSPLPRCLWSEPDRFMKGLALYFNRYSGWEKQLKANFKAAPSYWSSWRSIGGDTTTSDSFAAHYLNATKKEWALWKKIAADYSEFSDSYPSDDCVCAVVDSQAARFLEERYSSAWEKAHLGCGRAKRSDALAEINKTWDTALDNFFAISFKESEMRIPMWQQSWYPGFWPKFLDFQLVKDACKAQRFTPGVKTKWLKFLSAHNYSFKELQDVFPVMEGSPAPLKALWKEFKSDAAPAAPATPYALRVVWLDFLQSGELREQLRIPSGRFFDITTYNSLAGTAYASLAETPFPVPSSFAPGIRKLWESFVLERYPLRLTSIDATPALQAQYRGFLEKQYGSLDYVNKLLGESYASWNEIKLSQSAPPGEGKENLRGAWMAFVKTLPLERRILSSSEIEYQKFLLGKYKSLEGVNAAYGWQLARIEEAFPPFDIAYAVTFKQNEQAFLWTPMLDNYLLVWDFIANNANAIPVTLLLVVLAILCTLTINPLAAYALSRFNMRGQSKIILFMLATMSFPAMVSAIPAYLLMRDLGLLNTFWALVLPSAANGMAIFILKGFFDSLPPELFEAAMIDGANEWQIFRIVALPMVKPILAINSLGAFIAAYNGWEWALIICQKKSMWTIAVWLYQANSMWTDAPWTIMAGFVIASIPTLLVFLCCQKVIMKGIILPSMK